MNVNRLEQQTYDDLRVFEHNEKFLSDEVAFARYYHKEMSIYKTETGKYYCSMLLDEDKEYFHFDQPETISELEPLPREYTQAVKVLEEDQALIEATNFNLVEIESLSGSIFFTVYHPELQLYVRVNESTFKGGLTKEIVLELEDRNLAPNTLDKPVDYKPSEKTIAFIDTETISEEELLNG